MRQDYFPSLNLKKAPSVSVLNKPKSRSRSGKNRIVSVNTFVKEIQPFDGNVSEDRLIDFYTNKLTSKKERRYSSKSRS
jgi:hypothetical protein